MNNYGPEIIPDGQFNLGVTDVNLWANSTKTWYNSDSLQFTATAVANVAVAFRYLTLTSGKIYRLKYKYYIASGQGVNQLEIRLYGTLYQTIRTEDITLDAWTEVDCEFVPDQDKTAVVFRMFRNGVNTGITVGDDILLDDVSVVEVIPLSIHPYVNLKTTNGQSFGPDITPTIEFTGRDLESNDLRYHIQIDTVNTFDSQNILFDDFSDGNYTANPVWTVGSGTFSVNDAIANLDGNNYALQSTSAARISAVSKQAYGVWEFDVYCDNRSSGDRWINLISASTLNTGDGYRLVINYQGKIGLFKFTGGSAVTYLMYSNLEQILADTWYRIRVVRNSTINEFVTGAKDVFAMYISTNGTDFTLVDASASGSNPSAADGTYTTSSYFVFSGQQSGDRITNIRISPAFTDFPLLNKMSGVHDGFWRNIYSTNFSSTEGLSESAGIGTANNDGIGGQDDCYRYSPTNVLISHYTRYPVCPSVVGRVYKTTSKMYLPSSNSVLKQLVQYTGYGTDTVKASEEYWNLITTADTWVDTEIVWKPINDVFTMRVYGRNAVGAWSIQPPITDYFYLKDLVTNNIDIFPSAAQVNFTVPDVDVLPLGTYYYRVRAIDPSGGNTYGEWSEVRSFTIQALRRKHRIFIIS